MKLALDALEKLVRFESDSWEIGSCRIAGQATKALREALAEQPAQPQQEPVALEQERKAFEEWIDSGFINKGHAAFHKFSDRDAYCIDEIQNKWKAWEERAKRTTPQAQPQQEPVAWLDPWTRNNVTTDYDAYGKHGIPLYTHPQPSQQEPVAFSQFLSDVVTAAGLLSHGKTDKSLAARISEFAFRLRTSPQTAQEWIEAACALTKAADDAASDIDNMQEPDLSGLKPETQKQLRVWLADGSFVERVIGVCLDQERQLMVYEKAQPAQQEPVAWGKPTDEMVQAATDEYDEWANENKGTTECIRAMLSKALKASPQASKPWVGLTSEDKVEILRANGEAAVLILTEAKLREKNT